jgi:cyclopropane fatty-acyl-phospholipid synthase-like methyltransferase
MSALASRWDRYALHPERYVCSEPETTGPTVAKILDAMPSEGTVLDLGCGQGRLAVPVATSRSDLDVVAVDLSSRMLCHATYHKQVRYLRGNGYTIPPTVGRLDGAWSVLLFQHLPVDTIARYLFSLAEHLRVGAPLLAQYVIGDHHLDLDHRYQPRELNHLAQAAGFTDVTTCRHEVVYDWGWLHARRGPA